MRVDRLYLENFKNLKNFRVDFDISSPRQVVVGRNGVGKSNLLEALIWIFRDLDLEVDSEVGYEIEYHCNDHYVKIKSEQVSQKDMGESSKFKRSYAIVDASYTPSESTDDRPYKTISQTYFYKFNRSLDGMVNPGRLLPQYVFGYYSGVSGRFHEAFEKHEERYFREQVTGEETPLRPLFLAKSHHSQFALLSFFASEESGVKEFLSKEFQIDGLASILFSLHEPYWKRSPSKQQKDDSIDNRFWGAGGKVANFLDSLYQYALAPMAGKQRKKIAVGKIKNLERRYLFIPDETALLKLAEGLESKEFFARLESAIFSDLVSEDGEDVRIKIRLKDVETPVTFKELSEGEQQLLTIIGLMRFTAQNEGLFLLDEPDTHLNPSWCLDYLENLRKYGVEPPNSQIIMTTHSPLTFAGLDRNEVVILEREGDGQISSQHPISSPKGMGFQAILTSDFFGMRSTLDRETLALLDEKRKLGLKEDKTDEDRKKLTELDVQLGRLDFSKAARDPLYLEFIKAITKAQEDNPDISEAVPDKADWRLRKEIAHEIASKLAGKVQE